MTTQAHEFEKYMLWHKRGDLFRRTFEIFKEIEKAGAQRRPSASPYLSIGYEFPDGSVMNFSKDGNAYFMSYKPVKNPIDVGGMA